MQPVNDMKDAKLSSIGEYPREHAHWPSAARGKSTNMNTAALLSPNIVAAFAVQRIAGLAWEERTPNLNARSIKLRTVVCCCMVQ